jgi:predicted dithiol-disulfide oxidoreductase (DUF899 family)
MSAPYSISNATKETTMIFPNESKEYREARNELIKLEIAARRTIEAAARARRALPPGGKVPEDFVFQECDAGGNVRDIRLSELFSPHSPTLVIYSYMFGPNRKEPCPMCTGILDGLDGVDTHLRQRAAFAVVAQSSPKRLFDWSRGRDWQIRLLSAANNKYNQLYVPWADTDGNMPATHVFVKRDDQIYHSYAIEMNDTDPGQDSRGGDLLNPIFNFFDLTPEGRGTFYTSLHYPENPPKPDRTVEGAEIPRSARPD